MRLTQEEITETGLHLQALIAEMQAAGRAAPPPKFALSGPCSLMARFRSRGTFPAERAMFPFIGGEQFTLQAAIATESQQDGSVEIEVLMVAASASLAAKGVTSIKLSLIDAMERFDGMDDFVTNCIGHATLSPAIGVARMEPKVHARAAVESSAERGSW